MSVGEVVVSLFNTVGLRVVGGLVLGGASGPPAGTEDGEGRSGTSCLVGLGAAGCTSPSLAGLIVVVLVVVVIVVGGGGATVVTVMTAAIGVMGGAVWAAVFAIVRLREAVTFGGLVDGT